MKTKRVLYVLTVLLLLWLTAPVQAFAETSVNPEETSSSDGGRNIYAGDIVTLEIAAQGFSSEELREKFHDFEIVELKAESGGYLLSLRTFEPGEYTVVIGNKEIVISVASTLDDIQRDDIFEGDDWVAEAGTAFRWRILFYIAAGIFLLSGGFVLLRLVIKRKTKMPDPYQTFLARSGALSAEDDNYFVDLTLCFKEYLGSLYQYRIIGKTSSEIMNELKKFQDIDTILPAIQAWLTECDRLKFTGIAVSSAKKQEHCKELLDLAEKINKISTQKEGAS